ncbi:MAG: LytR/AlgR family response regulator transcription factor [Longimicrobiales bacterium]
MKIRVLIVEDEPLARERIRTLLADEPDVHLLGETGDGRSAVEAIRARKPDLVFLDVNIPELNGFGVIEEIGAERMPAVVFVTAYDQFAVKAFDTHALDYILKPFDEERFQTALDRARDALRHRDAGVLDERLKDLLDEVRRPHYVERLAVKAGGKILFLKTDDIDWIGAEGNYARLHSASRSHLLRETMSSLEEKLDPERFLRIHRSTIVNTDAIVELEPLFQGDYVVILRDGTRLTSSRGYRSNLQDFMNRAS